MIDWSDSDIEGRSRRAQQRLVFRRDEVRRKHYMKAAHKRGFRREPMDPTPLIWPSVIVIALGTGYYVLGGYVVDILKVIGVIHK